jgi:hypothetical protein
VGSSRRFQAYNSADSYLSIFAQEQTVDFDGGTMIGFDTWAEALKEFMRVYNNGGTSGRRVLAT